LAKEDLDALIFVAAIFGSSGRRKCARQTPWEVGLYEFKGCHADFGLRGDMFLRTEILKDLDGQDRVAQKIEDQRIIKREGDDSTVSTACRSTMKSFFCKKILKKTFEF
jgi:hypothetical protein